MDDAESWIGMRAGCRQTAEELGKKPCRPPSICYNAANPREALGVFLAQRPQDLLPG
jgi:hypothetical protein